MPSPSDNSIEPCEACRRIPATPEDRLASLILTKAVGKSVTICSLTTIAAFAALIPANHRGISSLGWVLTLGVSFILLATLIVLPALFELLGSRIEHAREVAKPPTGALVQPASSAPPPTIKVARTSRAGVSGSLRSLATTIAIAQESGTPAPSVQLLDSPIRPTKT